MGMTPNAIVLLVLLIAFLDLTFAADPTSDQSSLDFPIWAVVVMAIVVGLLVLLLCYFVLRRYLSKRRTVSTIDQVEKHHTPTTNTESTVTMDSINKRSTQVYKPAMIDQDKMALPFPPLSSSLFSDKMELNSDDAMQLFERYMQTDKPNKAGGLTTIDLDMPQLVNTVQQKMGTIKSTLRQSLRRQKSKSRSPAAAPLHHMFDSPEQPPGRKSLSELSRHTPSVGGSSSSPTPSPEVPPYVPSPILSKTISTPTIDDSSEYLDRNKALPAVHPPSPNDNGSAGASPLSKSPLAPSSSSTTTASSSSSSAPTASPDSSSSIPPMHPTATVTNNTVVSQEENAQHSDTSAIHAARRVIRSASRKSKTRSTLINDDAVFKMFSQGDGPNSFALPPEFSENNGNNNSSRDQRRASTTAAASGFTTVSGRSSNSNAASTRYLTNDILVRRASTLGKSFQQRKSSAARLENMFDAPSPSPPPPPPPSEKKSTLGNPAANEKVEVTEIFDLVQKQDNITLPPRESNQEDSSKYVVPHDVLLHPQQSRYARSPSPSTTADMDTPTSTAKSSFGAPSIGTGSKKRNTLTNNDGKRIIQDRMDNFEGISAHTDSTGHSRKSSTSVATMVRISQQHSQTWSGRAQSKRASLPQHEQQQQQQDQASQIQQQQQQQKGTSSPLSTSPGNNDTNKRPPMAFYTMRNTRTKQRTGLPSWYNPDDAQLLPQVKTPAERERDQYLKTLYGTADNNDTLQE